MAWTTYRSTDASAPVLSGTAGSLITVLDAVLVNGYGAKAAAGWTKVYSGTNKAAYRNGAASISRTFLRVLDDASGGGAGREASLRLYATMSDVDTGTFPVPTLAQCASGIMARKSTSMDSTVRAWTILADDVTAILIFDNGDSLSGVTYCNVNYVGDVYSYQTADAMGAFIGGRTQEAASPVSNWETLFNFGSLHSAGAPIGFIAGSHTGVAGSLLCYAITSGFVGGGHPSANLPYPSPVDGSVWVFGPFHIVVGAASSNGVRGHLRGINLFGHDKSNVANGDTVTGAGELSGRSFVLHRVSNSGVATASQLGVGAFETTQPPVSI